MQLIGCLQVLGAFLMVSASIYFLRKSFLVESELSCQYVSPPLEVTDNKKTQVNVQNFTSDLVHKNEKKEPIWVSDLSKDFQVQTNNHMFDKKYHPFLPTRINGLSSYEVSSEGIQHLLEAQPILRSSLSKVKEFRCTEVKVQNRFRLCSHGLGGLYDGISKGTVWELGLLKLAEDGMNNYGVNAIFLDIGANIGTHALYHLTNGRYVVAIDAMRDNVLDILLGALVQPKTEVRDRLALFHGGVSGKAEMLIPFKNGDNGVTRFVSIDEYQTFNKQSGFYMDMTDTVSTATVLDIIQAIPANRTIVMKVDIEGSECKAFADDAMLKDPNRFIPYVIMEFQVMNKFVGRANSMCTKPMVDKVIDNFHRNGYEMFTLKGEKVEQGTTPPWDIVWINKAAVPMKFKPIYSKLNYRRRK